MSNIYPKLRNVNSNSNWQTATLGDVVKEYKVSNKLIHHQNLLSLSYGKIVPKDIESKKGLLPASFDTYQIIKEDIIVFRVTDLQNDKKSLRVGISSQEGIITPAYVCVECNNKQISPKYLFTLLHYYDSITKVMYKMGDGLRQTLSYRELKDLVIYIPSINEQHYITDVFEEIDTYITIGNKMLASLKKIKEASLQAMFPQEGETVPKIRFKGFDGEWKKVKLGTLFSERTENDINGEMLSGAMHDGIIKASENGRFDNSNSDKSNYKLVLENDIAYNSMRMWQGASGCSPYRGIVSPAYTVITPYEDVNSSFFACYFKTTQMIEKFRLHSQGLTKDTWNLKFPAFSKITVTYPQSVNEQQAIASYFTALDKQISLQSQRLEKLKQIKAACLDKMFV